MTTTTTNYGFPKPAANEVGYAATFATAQDNADTAIKAAIDAKQDALATIDYVARSAADDLPSADDGAGSLIIDDSAGGYVALSHYAYGSMIYSYSTTRRQLEIWGYDFDQSFAMPIITFVAYKGNTRVSIRKSDDTDSMFIDFVSGPPAYAHITTEQNDTQIKIRPKSGDLTFGTTSTNERKIYVNAAKTLEDNVATAICEIACAAGDMIGGRIKYTARCLSDGGEYQSTSGAVVYAAVNKANTITSSVADSSDTTTACSDGTLTIAASVTNTDGASGKITIKLTANTSLTPTTLNCYYEIENDTGTNITPV